MPILRGLMKLIPHSWSYNWKKKNQKNPQQRTNNKIPKFILLHVKIWIQSNAFAPWMNSRLEKKWVTWREAEKSGNCCFLLGKIKLSEDVVFCLDVPNSKVWRKEWDSSQKSSDGAGGNKKLQDVMLWAGSWTIWPFVTYIIVESFSEAKFCSVCNENKTIKKPSQIKVLNVCKEITGFWQKLPKQNPGDASPGTEHPESCLLR